MATLWLASLSLMIITYSQFFMWINTRTYTHTPTHRYTHTHTHIHIQSHIHIHTPTHLAPVGPWPTHYQTQLEPWWDRSCSAVQDVVCQVPLHSGTWYPSFQHSPLNRKPETKFNDSNLPLRLALTICCICAHVLYEYSTLIIRTIQINHTHSHMMQVQTCLQYKY